MLVKVLLCCYLLNSVNGIFLFKLPSEDVEETFTKLASEKPHLMLSPNDASVSALTLHDLDTHPGHVKIDDAKNLVDLAESLNLTILVKGLEETGLDNIIDHEGKFTLFAPTDEAFHNIPEWAQKIPLKELLRYHVARGLIYVEEMTNDFLARSLLSKRDIRVNVYKNGKLLTANGSPISSFNYTAHNGVLHIVDKVMVSIYERGGSIVKELARCPKFKTITKLIMLAKLEEHLHERGPFTFFVPSDDVFAKLPADFVKHLVENPSSLRQVLLFHVGIGTWYSAGLEDGMSLKSLQGGKLSLSVKKGSVVINNNATVVAPDVTASNGVIHAIDSLLLPPMMESKLGKRRKLRKSLLKGRNGD